MTTNIARPPRCLNGSVTNGVGRSREDFRERTGALQRLYRNIPSVSEKVLSQVLKQLTTDGIIERQLYPNVPPRVEYSITDLGKTLLPHVEALIKWGQDNFEQIMINRHNNE